MSPRSKSENDSTHTPGNLPEDRDDRLNPYAIDRITEKIGVLTRRETEARILIPVIESLGEALGRDRVVEIVSQTIMGIARDQGRELAAAMGGNTPDHFREALKFWTRDNALEIKVDEISDTRLKFRVTRCRYAEMYRALGAAGLGQVFSCNRDGALMEGFNPGARMIRPATIMAGNDCCEFDYQFPEPGQENI